MAKYAYLLSMEESFYMKEHPYNPRVVKVRKLCTEIMELEVRAEQLREELTAASKDMMRNINRIRRVKRDKQ